MRGFIHKRVYARKDGTSRILYYAVVESTLPGSAKRRQAWGRGYATRKEAEHALNQRVSAIQSQVFVGPSKLTLGDYLLEHWLPLLKDRLKPTTLDSYRRAITGYVVPRIGRIKLQELSAMHLNQLYLELRESGGKAFRKSEAGQTRPLSQKTVRNVHVVLSKALNDAVDGGLLVTNVASRAKPPRQRGSSREVEAWTAEELAQFLSFVRDDRLFVAWHLVAHTGLRRGELLGLRWTDVDFDRRLLAIRQALVLVYTTPTLSTPKTHEARVVDVGEETVSLLLRHRQLQRTEQQTWGDDYEDSGLVFRREDGRAINPDRLSQMFDRHVRLSGIRRIKFHGLRHTHATLMLKAAVPIKVVSERLGHADPAFTLRVYQHVLSGMQAEAAARFADILRDARPDVRPIALLPPVESDEP